MRVSPYAGKESPRKGGSFPYQRHPVEMTDEKVSMNMSNESRIELAPWDRVLIVSITPEQEAAVRAEAAEAGADPARYLWEKIRNTPGVVVSP